MTSLFFYGTLRHLPLLNVVMGTQAVEGKMHDAVLDGHQARRVKGADFPMIIEMPGETPGVLFEGLSDDDIARLNFYEGGFEYELRDVQVQTDDGLCDAQVYFPIADFEDDGVWELSQWEARFGALTVRAAQEVMSYFGEIDDAQLAFMFPTIRVRAAAQLNAERENFAFSPSGFGKKDVTHKTTEVTHKGFFTLQEDTVAFRKYDGSFSGPVKREVFVGGDASIILPYDPVSDQVLLIEQFRAGPYARGDQKPWMLEPIAGRIDPLETPEEAARREGLEEAKLDFETLHPVAKCYASPGCNTEFFHIFVATVRLDEHMLGVNGVEQEAEDIKSYLFSFERLMEMTEQFEAANAPLVLAALWLARHRDRLRSVA